MLTRSLLSKPLLLTCLRCAACYIRVNHVKCTCSRPISYVSHKHTGHDRIEGTFPTAHVIDWRSAAVFLPESGTSANIKLRFSSHSLQYIRITGSLQLSCAYYIFRSDFTSALPKLYFHRCGFRWSLGCSPSKSFVCVVHHKSPNAIEKYCKLLDACAVYFRFNGVVTGNILHVVG